MNLWTKLFAKNEETTDEEIRYVQLGSPAHPNNPLNAEPAKPFTFTMTDSDELDIGELWCRGKWSQQPNAGVFVADGLDEMIVSAATLQAALLKNQMTDHVRVIARIRNSEPEYFHEKLQNKMEQHLKDLESVKRRLGQLPE